NTVCALGYDLLGFVPEPYYTAVLLTQLVNVWLLYRVLRSLTDSVLLACLGAALWGTSPLAVGTLGWYSVYGQVLVATILLLVLDRMGHRRGQAGVAARAVWWWCALLLVGATGFGTRIGVALVFPAVAFLLLPDTFHDRPARAALLALPLLVVALYAGCQWTYTQLAGPRMQEKLHLLTALQGIVPTLAMLGHLGLFGTGRL